MVKQACKKYDKHHYLKFSTWEGGRFPFSSVNFSEVTQEQWQALHIFRVLVEPTGNMHTKVGDNCSTLSQDIG